MCSGVRRRADGTIPVRLLISVLLLLLGGVTPTSAQAPTPGSVPGGGSAEERAALQAQIEATRTRLAQVEERIAERSRRLEARLSSEAEGRTFRTVGPFRIEGSARMLEDRWVDPIESAWSEISAALGDLSFLPELRIELVEGATLTDADLQAASGHRRVRWIPGLLADEHLRTLVASMVREQLPPLLVSWSQGIGWEASFQSALAYRGLLRSTHPSAVRCSQKAEVEACSDFLFLDFDGSRSVNLQAMQRWFPGPEEVATAGERIPAGRGRVCRDETSFDAALCREFLAEPRWALTVVPSLPITRGALLRRALEADPDGRGLHRARALPPTADIAAHLEAIAARPHEELVEGWITDLSLAHDTPMSRGAGGPGPFTLLWAGAFALLALRSTRWRLG